MSVTLAQIESEVARRLGPYDQFTVSSVTASTQTLVYVDELMSTVEQGGYDGRYVLRRAAALADDRVRMVTTFSAAEGYLEVDRPYTNPPAAAEAVEVMALHPSRQVRVAVQRGLDRCFFVDRLTVPAATAAAERSLSAAAGWLTRREQVLGVSWLPSGSVYAPVPVDWWAPVERGGALWLAASPDPAPNSLYVVALRPVSSLVNGLSAPPSPPASDVATGGSLLNDATYYAAVSTVGILGNSPASVPTPLLTARDGNNTHAGRLTVVQVPNQNRYSVWFSMDPAPLLVATITEAQRAAGCTITAQNTVSATSPGAGLVDVRVAGTGSAAEQAAPPSNDADVLDVPLEYAATAAHQYAWEAFPALLRPVAATGMTLGKDEVQAAWAKWVNRLPKPPDRFQFQYPYRMDA